MASRNPFEIMEPIELSSTRPAPPLTEAEQAWLREFRERQQQAARPPRQGPHPGLVVAFWLFAGFCGVLAVI